MKVTVLAGGVGGARFLLGVRHAMSTLPGEHDVTAVVNVGDDAWMYGVRICPDLDTCMYTLGGGVDTRRGWGHRDETWHARAELAAYGVQPDWFGLGDRDLATHLVRSQMLRAGYPLSAITEALCRRWQPGVRLLPASDQRSETHVVVTDPDGDGPDARRAIHFQEWWVRHRAQIESHSFAFVGADDATAGPGVVEAIGGADVVLVAPSNPVVSVGAILAVPGIRGALRSTAAPVVGFSPLVGGVPLRGMADVCLRIVGVDATPAGVARHLGARKRTGILDAWLVHTDDAADADALRDEGFAATAVPLLMTDPATTAEMVTAGLALVGVTPR